MEQKIAFQRMSLRSPYPIGAVFKVFNFLISSFVSFISLISSLRSALGFAVGKISVCNLEKQLLSHF